MSQFRMETMVCPNCNKQEALRLWEEINAKEDVTARNRLLDGELFLYRCKKCGYTATTAYNCIYKDFDRKFMIYFAADGDEDGMRMAMDKVEADAKAINPNVEYSIRRRIVRDGNSMQEKVIIFEADLDDRTIELMKMFYVSSVMENNPDMQIARCYFCIIDDNWRLEMAAVDGRTFAIDVQKELYQAFEDEYREEIDRIGETYFVDADYALNIYGENLSDPD